MTDAPPKRRPRFQLHISTCVVLMFVAGIVVYANVHPKTVLVTRPGSARYPATP